MLSVSRHRLICRGLRASPLTWPRTKHARSAMSCSAVSEQEGSAYMDKDLCIAGAPSGPLVGRTFALKDMYDVAGQRTGFGNPVWRETHPAAETTAPVVTALLAAGATLRGRTQMDELAYSLNGENAHYGTPRNPAAPGRIPGGSSSGSASACASGDVDFALGSDTGGSVRIPASYCGLFGFRPTHGRIPLDHARPLAPSFDTVGFFARDATLLKAVAHVLLASPAKSPPGSKLVRWMVARDAFALAEPATTEALYHALSAKLKGAAGILGPPAETDLAASLAPHGLGQLTDWFDVFRICQAWEIWQEHGEWVKTAAPSFGPGIKDRFDMAAGITREARDVNAQKRSLIREHVAALLKEDGVLLMPTAPGPAPLLDTPAPQLDHWRRCMISLTCVAGLAGLPQVNIPLATVEGMPVGLSLVGPAGSDERLLEMAEMLAPKA